MFILLLLEMKSIYQDRAEHDAEQILARTEQITKFNDIALRIDKSNLENQLHFDATMEKTQGIVTGLAANMGAVTGGDSFCYFAMTANGQSPVLVHIGKYTLYDVAARFTDIKSPFVPTMDTITKSTLKIGEFPPRSAQLLAAKIPFNPPGEINDNIFFSARNGFWSENLRGRYVNGKWVEAIRVFREPVPPGKKEVQILERIDKDYPRNKAGTIDWD